MALRDEKKIYKKEQQLFNSNFVTKRIAVDLDGTLIDFNTKSFSDDKPLFGTIKTGAREFLKTLKKMGYEIIIHTARPIKDTGIINKFLVDNDLEFDYINEVQFDENKSYKPKADAYVDDRGIGFRGDYEETLNDIIKLIGKNEKE